MSQTIFKGLKGIKSKVRLKRWFSAAPPVVERMSTVAQLNIVLTFKLLRPCDRIGLRRSGSMMSPVTSMLAPVT